MSVFKTAAAAGRPTSKPPPPPNGSASGTPKSILKKVSCTGKLTHNRRLTFHNKKKTKRIPNLNSMPEDILNDIWWSAEDYDQIMQSFEYTVFMMEAGSGNVVDDSEQHCTRGLELRTEAGKWARFEHKRDCYNAVLDEQDRQWNAGEDNQEKIANLCREVTAKTQRIACRKGMQDEQEIKEYVADTRLMLSKTLNSKKSKTSASSSSPSGASVSSNQSGGANGSKSLPARSKSNSTGQLKRRTPRTDSGKARVEKSPPRKPERVLSGKSERGDVTPTNSFNASGAPRTPKRSVSAKSSESSTRAGVTTTTPTTTTSANTVTPTNSARSINVQRMPQRQTFSNNSSSSTTPPATASSSSGNSGKLAAMAKKKIHLPKMPKRSSSNNSTASNASKTDSDKSSSGTALAIN